MAAETSELWVWRHPRAKGAAGRCIGRADVPVDARRAKRLAHRIRQTARRHGLPRFIITSHLQRSFDVGAWLHRWGWRHAVQPALAEVDFGRWDGLPWADVAQPEVDAWCADFLKHRPGDGESVADLFARAAAWTPPVAGDAIMMVGHAGWMTARSWISMGRSPPARADDWPAPPPHGACWRLPLHPATVRTEEAT